MKPAAAPAPELTAFLSIPRNEPIASSQKMGSGMTPGLRKTKTKFFHVRRHDHSQSRPLTSSSIFENALCSLILVLQLAQYFVFPSLRNE
jgi:hypothetical protein